MKVAPGTAVFVHQAFRCCPFAGAVSSQVHDYLRANGFRLVERPEDAAVHLVNTCGSDEAQARITWDTVAEVRRRTPGAGVVALGCLVSIDPRGISRALDGLAASARLDPRSTDRLDEIFGGPVRYADVQPSLRNEYVGNDFAKDWYHVVASTGCLGTCSFCAIRRATGRPRSRAVADVLGDMARGLAGGLHDHLLVSTDLSAWGTDLGSSVVELVAAATEAAGGAIRLAGESFEPTLFLEHFEALLPHLASGRWAYVGLPVQSGSARVLRRMSRTYDPDDVVAAVRRLKAEAPELVVRTDFIFGFGDETEAEFEDSLQVSRHFDLPSFNAYQPRPGTAPMELGEAVLRGRRDRALAELKRRAEAGWPLIRRWGGTADAPVRDAGARGGGDEPWERPEGRAWMVAQARRYAGLLRRHPRVALGGGWVLIAVRVDADAVVLGLSHEAGGAIELGLRRPDWPGGAMARGPNCFVWVRGAPPPPELDASVKVAVRAICG
jgi:tRNA A37 methylthiotransferase MiaB